MSTARDAILGNVRNALTGKGDAAAAAARLKAPGGNTIPARGTDAAAAGGLAALFVAEAERLGATTQRIGTAAIADASARWLAGHNLPGRLRCAPHPLLENIDWTQQTALEVSSGAARADDTASLSVAFAGVAETGTLVLHSGPESPTTLNFLPDNHIVVLGEAAIVGAYEEAWAMLRRAHGPGAMPRAVNWVSGPSRTADIEQTLLMGAHGPRRLHILILDDEKTSQA